MTYPATRLRRLRRTGALRALARETRLDLDAFVQPLFVVPGEGVRHPLPGLPGIVQLSVDELVLEADELASLGVRGLILFGAFVAVTELIPYLGPWIGAIPPFLYGLFTQPLTALWLVLLVLAIQFEP